MKNLVFGVHPVTYPSKKGEPKNLAEVAVWNEYGTRTAPPRPAFRMGLEHSIRANQKIIDAQLLNIARRVLQGRTAELDRNIGVVLTAIGKTAKKRTQEIIKAGETTPNAPSTVKRKGFNHPLYETGLLIENVAYEVV